MSDFKLLDIKTEENITQLILCSAPSNILGFELMLELSQALDQVQKSPFLILSSSVANFSMGVDIKIHTPELVPDMLKKFHAVIRKLYHYPGISLCVLNGYALGGGLELALPCDFLLAEQEAKLGFPEIRLACFPPVAAILLPRLVGRKANQMLLTGEIITAQQAQEFGLVDALFERSTRDHSVMEFTKKISVHSFDALRILKRVSLESSGFDFDLKLDRAEKFYTNDLLQSPDVAEGIEAFLEKRKPRFRDH